MGKDGLIYKAYRLYYDGFRSMTLGRTLWIVVLVKLFIIFVILKVFFFPNFLKTKAPAGGEAQYVGEQMVQRGTVQDSGTTTMDNE